MWPFDEANFIIFFLRYLLFLARISIVVFVFAIRIFFFYEAIIIFFFCLVIMKYPPSPQKKTQKVIRQDNLDMITKESKKKPNIY